jgi:transcriptional regulator with XRE-family HTH domain
MRTTMKTEIDFDAITVDGARLKAAREERGMSVTDMAAAVTLSREQIQHMEDGGNRPFYTPAHKLLAVRKYSTALDIPYDEIVTGPGANQTIPVPEDAPPSMMAHSDLTEPADLRLAAVERNAEVRRLIAITAIVVCILLAIYAKIRGTKDESLDNEVSAEAVSNPIDKPVTAPSAASRAVAANLPPPDKPVPEVKLTPSASPVTKDVKDVKEDNDTKREPALAAATDASDECQISSTSDVKSWSPSYQRKSDSRLYVISPKGGSVCISDATGKSRLIELKPMVGQSVGGKPPYLVRSSKLAQIEIYLQGLRVKIPSETEAMKLIPTSQPAPAEATEPAAQ